MFVFRLIIIVFQAFNPNFLKMKIKNKTSNCSVAHVRKHKAFNVERAVTPQIHVALLEIDLPIFTLLGVWG